VPHCTYTDPEIAHVGLTVDEARQRGLRVQTVQTCEVDRAVLTGDGGFSLRTCARAPTASSAPIVLARREMLQNDAPWAGALASAPCDHPHLPHPGRCHSPAGRRLQPDATNPARQMAARRLAQMDALMNLGDQGSGGAPTVTPCARPRVRQVAETG
jgi:hypothetical protein